MQFTGNQVGVLLGHYLLTAGKPTGKRLCIASIVSSPLLGVIAREMGVRYEETLTGFKWIANRAMELEREGYTFVFGFEEALGYTAGDVVRDKDGISAAVLFAELCAVVRARGQTLLDELEAIHRRYGLFLSGQVTLGRRADEIRALMQRLRDAAPSSVGAHRVAAIADYDARVRRDLGTGVTSELTLPRTNMLILDLVGGSRVIARPSGTEPKVKFYFDYREAVVQGEPLAAAAARAEAGMKALSDAFVAMLEA